MKMRIMLDFDDVIYDTTGALLKIYNEKKGDNVTKEDIKEWNLSNVREDLVEYFQYIEFTENGKNNAEQNIKEMIDMGHDVYIVTASHPNSFIKKYKWVHEHLPFFDINNMVLCKDKSIIDGHIMVDDGLHNIETSICGMNFLYDMNHNRNSFKYTRIYSLYDVVVFLQQFKNNRGNI